MASIEEAARPFIVLERELKKRATATTQARADANAIRAVAEAWFRTYRPPLADVLGELGALESVDEAVRALRSRAGTRIVIDDIRSDLRFIARSIEREILPAYDAARWSTAASPNVSRPESAKDPIADRLSALNPQLGESYLQVLGDLQDESRLTYLGPAGEIREVFRAAIHELSPDDDVKAQDWFVGHEGRPTQTERIKYILQQADIEGQVALEGAGIVEDKVARLGRLLYGRSSSAFHAGTSRDELGRIVGYVQAILNEILPDVTHA